jgi:hypothetical protein
MHEPDIRPQKRKGIRVRREYALNLRRKRTTNLLPEGQMNRYIGHEIISISHKSITEILPGNKPGRRG